MNNMQVFYKKITSAKPETASPYLSNLEKLTHLDAARLQSTVSDLWWNDWESPVTAAIAHQ